MVVGKMKGAEPRGLFICMGCLGMHSFPVSVTPNIGSNEAGQL